MRDVHQSGDRCRRDGEPLDEAEEVGEADDEADPDGEPDDELVSDGEPDTVGVCDGSTQPVKPASTIVFVFIVTAAVDASRRPVTVAPVVAVMDAYA